MLASVAAWTLAIVFVTAGLEKLVGSEAREDFISTVRAVPIFGSPVFAYLFLIGELTAIPLLLVRTLDGLNLLVFLAAAISLFALVAWVRGDMDSCGCGGIWAASGRNLFVRNGVLLLLAVYARLAAPVPLMAMGAAYAVGVILLVLVAAGIAEAVRVRMRTG